MRHYLLVKALFTEVGDFSKKPPMNATSYPGSFDVLYFWVISLCYAHGCFVL